MKKYVGIIAAIFGGEMAIKNYVEENFDEDTRIEVMQGHVMLRKYHNRGACLNLGEKKQPVVAALSVLLTVLAGILFILSFGRKGNTLLKLGLAVLLGGAFSNTYDRLVRKYVVDYFSFQVKCKPLSRVIFNLADFAILFGALLVTLTASSK